MPSYRFSKGDETTLPQEFVSYTNKRGARKGDLTLLVALERSTKLKTFPGRVEAIREMEILVDGSYDKAETTKARKALSRHVPVVVGSFHQLYHLERTNPLSYEVVNATQWNPSLFNGPVEEAYVVGTYPAKLFVAGNCLKSGVETVSDREIFLADKAIKKALAREDLYLFGPDGQTNSVRKNFPNVYRVSDLKKITLG